MTTKVTVLGDAHRAWLDRGRTRFWTKVDRGNPDECWLYKGGRQRTGYGVFVVCGRVNGPDGIPILQMAHRMALYYEFGTWGEVARHDCDNPPCCNPGHLRWGTNYDNVQDAVARNRNTRKLSSDQVTELRRLRAERVPYKEMSRRLGIGITTIQRILGGQVNVYNRVVDGVDPGFRVPRNVGISVVIEANRMHRDGASIGQIAKKLGLGWRTARKCVQIYSKELTRTEAA